MTKDEELLNAITHFVPLNEKGEEMSYEELDCYVKSLPNNEKPNKIEDAAFFIEGDLEAFISRKGGVPIESFLKRYNIEDKGY